MPKREPSVGRSPSILLGDDIDKELQGLSVAAQRYIEVLEAENLKAQNEIAKLKAENLTYKHRAAVLDKRLSELHVANLDAILKDDPRLSVEALLEQAGDDKSGSQVALE